MICWKFGDTERQALMSSVATTFSTKKTQHHR